MISFNSLKKPVVNITNTSTNKAFQVLVDPSCLQSPFNCRNELFAPCHVLFSPKARIHTRIELLDLEFLDSVIQCFQNTCQRAITELVYFVEPHDLSFIVVDQEDYSSRRLNDGIIMLELIAGSIPSWCTYLQSTSVLALAVQDRSQDNEQPSSWRLTIQVSGVTDLFLFSGLVVSSSLS
ncbi:hypothetical protein Tco_1262727 [Tanacetum coccineum]